MRSDAWTEAGPRSLARLAVHPPLVVSASRAEHPAPFEATVAVVHGFNPQLAAGLPGQGEAEGWILGDGDVGLHREHLRPRIGHPQAAHILRRDGEAGEL